MNEFKIAVVGLGYVGLPLAVNLAKYYDILGFDIDIPRLNDLKNFNDKSEQISVEILKEATRLTFSYSVEQLKSCNVYILAIPTPVNKMNMPDLSLLTSATEMIGRVLKKGDIVVYESTVYPGVTEEVCLPVLEKISGLKNMKDFKLGYSPERINPGDNEHALEKVIKIVSAQDDESLEKISSIYSKIVKAGIHKVSCIRAAEAAKVLENTQRDLNIALMNEIALIFDRMGIDTKEVIEAAATKWNFMKFTPGLVGGHCIGVDPYYLTFKAQELNYFPEVILAGRRINDLMGKFVAEKTIKELIKSGHSLANSLITVLGLSYKENCTDIRNSKTFDIINEFEDYKINFQIHDPIALENHEVGFKIERKLENLKKSEAIIVTVPHKIYLSTLLIHLKDILKPGGVFIDVKGSFKKDQIKELGFIYWRL